MWSKSSIEYGTNELKRGLPIQSSQLLDSYILNRFFGVKQEETNAELKEFNAGVSQDSVLRPTFYLLYTGGIPDLEEDLLGALIDD